MNIPFNQQWNDNAHHEQEMRAPHMLTKFKDNAKRRAGQIRGLVIEHHVSGWMENKYPNNYGHPDNHQQWTEWCSHDFKLTINGKTYAIDVTGPKADGTFGSYSQKPKYGVDFHIMCNAIGFQSWNNVDYSQGFKILGVVEARHYLSTIDPNNIILFKTWLTNIGL